MTPDQLLEDVAKALWKEAAAKRLRGAGMSEIFGQDGTRVQENAAEIVLSLIPPEA